VLDLIVEGHFQFIGQFRTLGIQKLEILVVLTVVVVVVVGGGGQGREKSDVVSGFCSTTTTTTTTITTTTPPTPTPTPTTVATNTNTPTPSSPQQWSSPVRLPRWSPYTTSAPALLDD